MYDPRVGRWFAQDSKRNMYPGHSSYNYALNSPMFLFDPNGLWVAKIDVNSAGEYSLTFVAEENDNINTLAIQLGIPIKSLLKKDPNLSKITILKSTELKLSKIPEVNNINIGINIIAKNQSSNNCANLADKCDGSDENNVSDYGTTNNVDEMAKKIAGNGYLEINDKDTKIGDIIHYRLSESDRKSLIESETNAIEAGNYSDVTKAAFIRTSTAKINELFDGERHFSVIILKDKNGLKPSQIIQKHGGSPFEFKVDDSSDTTLVPIDLSLVIRTPTIRYEENAVEGKKEENYRKKEPESKKVTNKNKIINAAKK